MTQKVGCLLDNEKVKSFVGKIISKPVSKYQITAQITAAISKPSPRHTTAPGKAQQAEEALSVMVDMMEENSIKEGEDMKDGVNSKSPKKPHDNDLSSKLRELGLKNLDDLSKS